MELFKEIDREADIYGQIGNAFNVETVIAGNLVFGNNIPVFFVQFRDLNDMASYWREFNSFITAEYLVRLEDDFSKWNSYVFYLSTESIPKSLKYEIENNKFSTRKIVIESIPHTIEPDLIKSILSEHIINDNIAYNVESQTVDTFIKNKIISDAVSTTLFNKANELKEENLLEILDKLEKKLGNEN